jgi:DNA-binding transcriptional MerR regulator
MTDKSPDAFRTISEVGEDLDLPQHVLRFWETRFPQIKPLKRGGGRRYYRPEDVALIMGLKALLYGQGYTIKGVQRILKEQGARHVQAIGRGAAHAPPPDAGYADSADDAAAMADIDTAAADGPAVEAAAAFTARPSSNPAAYPARLTGASAAAALAELRQARAALHAVLRPPLGSA